jgi:hypothetical protein
MTKKNEVTKLSMTNTKTRRFMENSHHLIDLVFDKEEDTDSRDTWTDMITQYNMAMKILQKRSDYMDAGIETFQN